MLDRRREVRAGRLGRGLSSSAQVIDAPVERADASRPAERELGEAASAKVRSLHDALRMNRHRTDERTATVDRAVTAAKRGDGDAFRYLYVRFADDVYRYVRRVVHDRHEAEDVTQQVFAKLMTRIDKYEQREDVPFSAWILRVARNVALDHLRQLRAVPTDDVYAGAVPTGDPTHADDVLSGDRSLALRDALASLPDDQKRVLVLRHVVGLAPPEIARRLGRSEGAVNGLHHRARAAMRTALTKGASGPSTMASPGR
jgi:RNA polymerase sigma-70 factor (ECF subfamily)